MNAHQKTLTHSDYTARRSRLRADLVAAKTAQKQAELQAAHEEISKDDLDESRAAVANIEAQLRGLDMARQESERLEERQQAINDTAERRKAAKRARDLAAMRAEEMRKIDAVLASLAPHLKAIADIEVAIRSTISPHLRQYPEEMGDLMSVLNDRTSENAYLGGKLFTVGFSSWGLGQQFPGPMADLDLLNTTKSNAVETAARYIAGED